MRKRNLIPKSWIIIIVITIFITFFQLPFYISTPGMARELAPIIEVEGGFDEEGNFMLTTVGIRKANIVQYAIAKMNDYHHIIPEDQIRPEGETDVEYKHRQLHMMDSSKEAAIVVAYQKANKKLDIVYNGVYVLSVLDDMPAIEKLKIGDRIYEVNGEEVKTSEQLIKYVSNKNEGDIVNIYLERESEKLQVALPLATFPSNQDKVGLGIKLVTDRKITVDPPITIETDQIGGPSAGLMFSLEIYNQLVEEDITKGYQIAGTGTVSYEGEVGPIGGIEQKVVAAHKAGAEIFFAPNEKGDEDSNYVNALAAAEDIGTKMKVIPIDTFEDAISYLTVKLNK